MNVDGPHGEAASDQLAEYVEEAAFVWLQRRHAVKAPHYDPVQFHDLDERLAANLDGLKTSGAPGWSAARQRLEHPDAEVVFVSAALALTSEARRFDDIVERVGEVPTSTPGVVSALGWVPFTGLGNLVPDLLESTDPLRCQLGLAACGLHRRDCGPRLRPMLDARAAGLRHRALRVVGELGRRDLAPALHDVVESSRGESAWWASRSLVLIGDHGAPVDALGAIAGIAGPRQRAALDLALLAADTSRGHEILSRLRSAPGTKRLQVQGAGLVGDVRYVPWLIDAMSEPSLARIAAESFALITGADFNLEQLEAPPPEGDGDGPSDDPDDEDVELPEDIPLPWPDVQRVKAWWAAHASAFTAGARVFLGKPVTGEHCLQVLRNGLQRQRVLAAYHRILLVPGTMLFPTSAPAWRQRVLLDAMR